MIRTPHLTLFCFATLASSALGIGCKASACPDPGTDGGSKSDCVELQTLDRYNGTPFDVAGTWATGKTITIVNVSGDVTVTIDGSDNQIKVHAKPFDMDTGDEAGKQACHQPDSNDLAVTVDDSTGDVKITRQQPPRRKSSRPPGSGSRDSTSRCL